MEPIIVLGMRKKELKKPYSKYLISSEVKALHRYLNGRDYVHKCSGNEDGKAKLSELSENGNLEVVSIIGAYGGQCVAATIAEALVMGLKVKSPADRILFIDHDKDLNSAVRRYINEMDSNVQYAYSLQHNFHNFSPQINSL